jgi:hypothetical protein
VRRAGNLTTIMCGLCGNLGASTSWSPKGLSRPVQGLLYLYCICLGTLNVDVPCVIFSQVLCGVIIEYDTIEFISFLSGMCGTYQFLAGCVSLDSWA